MTEQPRGRGKPKCLSCRTKESHIKYNETNKDEWIECTICGYRAKELASHLKAYHDIDPKDYGITKSTHARNRILGERNPAYQHNGKFSVHSKNFIHGYDKDRAAKIHKEHSVRQTNNPNNKFSRAAYKTDEEYTKAQTRDLDWFINKYGVEEGKRRHAEKTAKWLNSYKKNNYSKISQELFDEISKIYKSNYIYYATYDREDKIKFKNKEYRYMSPSGKGFLFDFVDISKKLVIEFDGDYWHSEAKVNPQREQERTQILINDGFLVLRIREQDYKRDKQGTLNKCIQFLTQ